MKIKHSLSLVILFILLASFLFPSKLLATSWAYPFVVWDGYIYVVSDEYVTDIDSKIGQVTKYSDMEQYSGNFSNAYKKGTKYYSIESISTDEAIAIQDKDGKYKKAVREVEYTYAEEKFDFSGLVVGLLVPFFFPFLDNLME
ncbi:hypothetical protein MHI57_03135 [Cytobacillus sp. FSL K6-0129]|uniref:hypothetical protein n=1 Tax=Cytobacillus sp. FSL K6-0129 TaxID=2921421 RepID=UPI0030F82FA4